MVEIAGHPLLGQELALRGGAGLHKLLLPEPLRYVEDLDYARTTRGPIGPILDAIREIAGDLALHVNTDVGTLPRVRLRGHPESGSGPMRMRIEIDTYETTPARPHRRLAYRVDSPWWSGRADVLTFQPEELVAAKLRTLLRRERGRDLFDVWVGLTRLGLDPGDVRECFAPDGPDGDTVRRARRMLERRPGDAGFRADVLPLLVDPLVDYDIDAAATLVLDMLLTGC